MEGSSTSPFRYELEALDRLEAARLIIELLLAGHATLDPDTLGHLGHMLSSAGQKLAYALNFVGDGGE